MRTTVEISRTSIQMALTTITGVFPEGKKPLTVMLIEKKMSDFLSTCPDLFFKLTVESSNSPTEGK